MSTETIPLTNDASVTLVVTLSGQACRINVYQKSTGKYIDIYVNEKPVVLGVITQTNNRIVRSAYLGFIGDLYFDDAGALKYVTA